MGKEFNKADKGKTFKQGGDMKKMAMGGSVKPTAMGSVKTAAPSRDGVASKGKTKGTQVKMAGSGVPNGIGVKTMKRGGKC